MDIMLTRILATIPSTHGAKTELCKFLGIRTNAVTEWIAGRNKSYPKYAPQIAEYYGVSLDWLSGLTDDKTKKNPASLTTDEVRARTVKMITQLSEEEFARVDAYVHGLIANRKDN